MGRILPGLTIEALNAMPHVHFLQLRAVSWGRTPGINAIPKHEKSWSESAIERAS